MSCLLAASLESHRYEHAKLVVKHTFLEFQYMDAEVSPKLRRHKSDSLLPCAVLEESPSDTGKRMGALTPTTCSSVNGDDDDVQSSLSSPMTADEDGQEDGAHDCRWSFSSSVVNELLELPQTPLRQAASNNQTEEVRPEVYQSLSLLSTSPLSPAVHSRHQHHGTPAVHSTCYDNVHDGRTTLMVRNLPTELCQQDFVKHFIGAGYGGLFDFVYMPMNLRASGNFGYAFINFSSHYVAAHIMTQIQNSSKMFPETQTRGFVNGAIAKAGVPMLSATATAH